MNFLTRLLQGIAISISQLVPGVSGGTIAIILGVYDQLLESTAYIFKDFKKHFPFLFQIGLGVIMGMILFSRLIAYLFGRFPFQINFFFLGIILGGVPLMYKQTRQEQFKPVDLIYILIGFVIVLMMGQAPQDQSSIITTLTPFHFVLFFVGGFVVAIALILPGISGSFMLFLLGLYGTLIHALSTLNLVVLIPMALGILVGTLATTRLINYLLNRYTKPSYSIILGFILGSIPTLFPGLPPTKLLPQCLLLFVIGFILIWAYNTPSQ